MSKQRFSIILLLFIVGMLLCVFFALLGDIGKSGNFPSIIDFILFFIYMFFLFLFGIPFTGYHGSERWIIHNIIFYLFLISIIIIIIILIYDKIVNRRIRRIK